jgi:eukaryotic-like serine/threonine-protein kinase
MSEQPTGATFGRYVLGPRLGLGGMGEVYHALQLGLGEFAKPLALKLLLPHLALRDVAVRRFLEEARLASRLNHPNIVQLLDVGVVDGRYFIAMELVRGISLARLLRELSNRGQQLSLGLWLHIARSVCDGLQHAHTLTDGNKSFGLIHRDMTPENVLVSVEGQVRVSDFGIAQVMADKDTAAPLVGKIGYLAPEQLLREAVDQRADLFSLGVTLFFAATQVAPFPTKDAATAAQAIIHGQRPALFELRPDFSAEVAAVVSKCLARLPSERFDSARSLRNALPAPPPEAGEQLGDLVRQVWGDARLKLEDAVKRTQQLKAHTEQLSRSGSMENASLKPKPRRWGLGAVLAAIGALGTGVAVTVVAIQSATGAQRVNDKILLPRGDKSTDESAAAELPAPAKVVAAPAPPPPKLEEGGEPDVPVVKLDAKPKRKAEPNRRPARPVVPPKVGPAKEVRAEAAQAAPGILAIDARPWGRVTVNGVFVGDTPIASFPAAPGMVTVELSNPETNRSVTRRVRVVSGERQLIKEDLR